MLSASFVGNANLIGRLNRSSILRLVKERGSISRAEIAEVLALNPATVGRIVSQLLKNNLLVETGAAPSRGGRRATLVRYNQKAGAVIGLDLNGFDLLGVLADLGGDVIRRIERPASPTCNPQENLDQVYAIVHDLLHSEPHVAHSLRGIGVGCPSVTLNPDGLVVLAATLGWRNVPLKFLLQERFGHPVFVQNESDLGALAESLWGAGQGAERLVWLNIGPGIGSGIVLHGQLYQGAHNAAGEVGYLVPGIQSLGQRYDPFGCMETLSASVAILNRARQAIDAGDQGALRDRMAQTGDLKVTDVFEAARLNDPLALRLTGEMVDYVSLIITSITAVLDPDLIVLGRELATAGDLFLSRIQARIEGVVPSMPQIVISKLGTEAIVKGAVALALQATEEQFLITHSPFSEPLVLRVLPDNNARRVKLG